MKSLFIAVAIGGWLLTGCSRSGGIPEHQSVRNAPTEASKTGLLVLGAQESDLTELAESNARVFVRTINKKHGLYEVHGTNSAELKKSLGPNAVIRQNLYRRVAPTKMNNSMSLLDFPFQEEFIEGCRVFTANREKFDILLESDLDKFELSHIYQLGEKVKAVIQSDLALNYMWMIDAPQSSELQNMSGMDSDVLFYPDTNGEYLLSVISKNERNECVMQKRSIYVTSNPSLDNQARLSQKDKTNFDIDGFWHLEFLGLPQLWEASTGTNVTIAIIDTGVNYNHEALNENIHINPLEIPDNGIDDDNNGYVDDSYGYDFSSSDPRPFDDNGHGTHVAGLAAASTFGIAKDAKIMPLKTLTGLGTDTGSFVGAIYYAVDQGADIINASFGWKTDHPIFRKAMEYARDNGVLVVTASGNGNGRGKGVDNDKSPFYPTNYDHPNLISVAAVDEDNELAPYSNFGKTSVDIATFGGAPWLKLYSTSHKKIGGKIYVSKSGTSQAAPIVSGAAALLLSKHPELTAEELKLNILSSSQSINELKPMLFSGGILDIDKLLNPTPRPMSSL